MVISRGSVESGRNKEKPIGMVDFDSCFIVEKEDEDEWRKKV